MQKIAAALFAAFAGAALIAGCASAPPKSVWVPNNDGSVAFYVARCGRTMFNTVHHGPVIRGGRGGRWRTAATLVLW